MRSPKGLLVAALVVFGALFFAFTSNKHSDITITQKQKLLSEIGEILERQHYSPKIINDAFSKQVFKKYLEELDGDKVIFSAKDIESLKKYETYLDDEIHGSEIKFVPAVSAIYNKRVNEVIQQYKDILSKPFDFTVNEEYLLDGDKVAFSSEAEKKDRFRKYLKYRTLERYADLIEQRDKSTVDSIKSKTDVQLEQEARERVLKLMNKIYDRIKAKFTDDERFNTYINVITNLMDPHTDYFPPVEKRAFDEVMSGRFFGIGALLSEQDGQIKIASIVTGGPAWKSGEIMANDIVLKVAQGKQEPVDVAGYDVQDVVKLIRGSQGTEVMLTLKKQDGTVKTISLIRDEIVQDEGFARSVIVKKGSEKIGYIYLPDFYFNYEEANGARCSKDVAKEVEKLKAENVKGIVMDLRSNGGGSLNEVVEMVGLFIGKGPVVQVRDRDGRVSVLTDKNSTAIYNGPLAVMVNEMSASASEIFAAAIQDYKRGIIVGSSSSYGKGTVQRNIGLGKTLDFFTNRTEYGALKLSFQKFYRIDGRSTQLAGVTPDVILPDSYDYLKIREKDNPAALPWDEIAKTQYAPVSTSFNLNAVIKNENNAIKANEKFNLIKQNTVWMSKFNEAPVNLNYKKYKEQQKSLKTTAEQINNLTKLEKDMDMEVMDADKDKFFNNPDKQKGERYKAWLKAIKSDIYISQTADFITDLIHSQVQTAAK
ncbi:MAG: carboxy terminal-processing peptidase [Sphingobacteriia bacterium]|nr:carboxy terminal-processing peptidase [Sphingobacteriia bacterium]